jgi:hypothetical protein
MLITYTVKNIQQMGAEIGAQYSAQANVAVTFDRTT